MSFSLTLLTLTKKYERVFCSLVQRTCISYFLIYHFDVIMTMRYEEIVYVLYFFLKLKFYILRHRNQADIFHGYFISVLIFIKNEQIHNERILHKYFWYWLKQYTCIVSWKEVNFQSSGWFWGKKNIYMINNYFCPITLY